VYNLLTKLQGTVWRSCFCQITWHIIAFELVACLVLSWVGKKPTHPRFVLYIAMWWSPGIIVKDCVHVIGLVEIAGVLLRANVHT
jgi:hypothetical protein